MFIGHYSITHGAYLQLVIIIIIVIPDSFCVCCFMSIETTNVVRLPCEHNISKNQFRGPEHFMHAGINFSI